MTKSLANFFHTVTAVDISSGNLKIAEQHVTADNIDFRLIKDVEDYGKLPKADVVYSSLVLQHNCPPIIEYLIDTMFQLLKDNGIAIFQVPTYKSGYSFEYESYINKEHGMEMHVLPQQIIFELAYKNNCIPLEVYPYDDTGINDHSMVFIFTRKRWHEGSIGGAINAKFQ